VLQRVVAELLQLAYCLSVAALRTVAAAALDAARRRKAPAEELARLSEAYDSAAGALEAANAA
jgi:hypothetical protein